MQHHILFAERGPQSTGLLLSARALSPIRITTAHSGGEALEVIARDKPSGAFIDLLLPDISGLEVARHAVARGVPAVLRAPDEAKLAVIEKAGFPCLVEPLRAQELIAASRMLLAAAKHNVAQLQYQLRRLQRNRQELNAVFRRLPGGNDLGAPERLDRLRRSGVAPHAARRPTLLDDWDVVRAAQHMIEVHGENAAHLAKLRAGEARDLRVEKRWRAIADAIHRIGGS